MHGLRFLEQARESIGAQKFVQMDPTGRYARFDEVLGKGAMKTVYKAIDEVFGIEVAWNQVNLTDLLHSPDDLQRLYSEVHLLSTLNHDSIIRFYTSWIDAEQRTFNFITEMLTSGTLREYRLKYKGISMRAIKIWAREILEGIMYLHGRDPPVIHRDLKCDNIFVNGHLGQVKIGDLGLAAILRGPRRAHSVIGTPEFMAPELYEENYNELVDVYSYGMCVLEMVTSEYPYSECTNPAQIYKKVTSGKKPRAFYKVQDLEAQRFIGKCLEPASKRLSAKDLLFDPFLLADNFHDQIESDITNQKPFLNANVELEHLWSSDDDVPKTNMTITGKLNPEDDTIFLKVQIAADKKGDARNVFFPFDIVNDTPMDVANEMVKELDITDWKPSEIANMIDGEISGLVPNWNSDHKNNYENCSDQQTSYSSSISSQVSFSSSIASQRMDTKLHSSHWLQVQDDLFDDASSQTSAHSEKYSNWAYHSADESDREMSPRRHDRTDADDHMRIPSRFYPGENSTTGQNVAPNCYKQCKEMLEYSNKKSTCMYKMGPLELTKNRSLVDTRSQLLHQSLVKEVNRRRLFKTAGDVESVGFQSPYEGFGNLSTQRMNGMSSSSSLRLPSHLKGMQKHMARQV